MCLRASDVRPHQCWRWGGEEIVHNPVIPASRRVPGTNRTRYPIDIREYLSTDRNAVVHHELDELRAKLEPRDRAFFDSNAVGSYDFRAHVIRDHLHGLKYLPSGRRFDDWLFPDETLARGGGDCEDLAFVLAAMLQASGVSQYCVRVSLGSIVDHSDPERPRRFHHAWVVYQTEAGAWQILEPMAKRKTTHARRRAATRRAKPEPRRDIEYLPHFVFNREHLWRVRTPEHDAARPLVDYLEDRVFWKGFNPSFAAGVHDSIYDEALAGMSTLDLIDVKRVSLGVDVNVLEYDPRDHFDFAYVPESWRRVTSRLATGKLKDFALAAHAIGDFYAHTLYADFAPRRANGTLVPYDPATGLPAAELRYDFSPYPELPACQGCTREEAAARWQGKLISGQWWRWFTAFPDQLEHAKNFGVRRCLPDHDMVAVDSMTRKPAHCHYDPAEYARQFALRRAAAVEHIALTYRAWKSERLD